MAPEPCWDILICYSQQMSWRHITLRFCTCSSQIYQPTLIFSFTLHVPLWHWMNSLYSYLWPGTWEKLDSERLRNLTVWRGQQWNLGNLTLINSQNRCLFAWMLEWHIAFVMNKHVSLFSQCSQIAWYSQLAQTGSQASSRFCSPAAA